MVFEKTDFNEIRYHEQLFAKVIFKLYVTVPKPSRNTFVKALTFVSRYHLTRFAFKAKIWLVFFCLSCLGHSTQLIGQWAANRFYTNF